MSCKHLGPRSSSIPLVSRHTVRFGFVAVPRDRSVDVPTHCARNLFGPALLRSQYFRRSYTFATPAAMSSQVISLSPNKQQTLDTREEKVDGTCEALSASRRGLWILSFCGGWSSIESVQDSLQSMCIYMNGYLGTVIDHMISSDGLVPLAFGSVCMYD